jgi:hypothetical protein
MFGKKALGFVQSIAFEEFDSSLMYNDELQYRYRK